MKYYLVGIKGTGMSSLAIYLKQLGNEVTGSDDENHYFTEDGLLKNDIAFNTYDEDNIDGNYIYIVGLSVDKNNCEFKKIIKYGYEFYYYNNFIGYKTNKKIIAISGTHGKTTTSYFLSQITSTSSIIGCGYGLGNDSKYLVVEACEYKNHFLSYRPYLSVIQSIDYDHPDFFKNKKSVYKSFKKLANNSENLLINNDLIRNIDHPHLYTYGFKKNSTFKIRLISASKAGYRFVLKGGEFFRILYCPFCGIHNLYNYVAAVLAAYICDIKLNNIEDIKLPIRRMTKINYGDCILINDYAHHPSEINALTNSLKMEYSDYKLNVIFQSHTYTRTLKFKRSFKKALKNFNQVYIMDVFASKRENIDLKLQSKINKYFNCFKKYNNLDMIDKTKKDIWVFLGAGNTDMLFNAFLNDISENNNIQDA